MTDLYTNLAAEVGVVYHRCHHTFYIVLAGNLFYRFLVGWKSVTTKLTSYKKTSQQNHYLTETDDKGKVFNDAYSSANDFLRLIEMGRWSWIVCKNMRVTHLPISLLFLKANITVRRMKQFKCDCSHFKLYRLS